MNPGRLQPKVLPFPGYPAWGLFFCACWREKMEDGIPRLPTHIEAAITTDTPQSGHTVACPRCHAIWFYRESSHDWLKLDNSVEIPMSGAQRLTLYKEGLANEAFETDSPARETLFEPSPNERINNGKPE